METTVLKVSSHRPARAKIRQAGEIILKGGLVGFPTETVYGLGANALDEAAVAKIFVAKGRPPNDPIIVHIAHIDDLSRVARNWPTEARLLGEHFWPGPLTIVVPKADTVPLNVTAGLETVAVRIPAHQVALALIEESGVPIGAPSANFFGHASPTSAQHVWDDLAGKIELILDAGSTSIGVESTVVDLTKEKPIILRPGGTSLEDLRRVLANVEVTTRKMQGDNTRGLESPGLMTTHYSPRAELWLFLGREKETLQLMKERAQSLHAAGKRIGLMIADEDVVFFEGERFLIGRLGSKDDLSKIAHSLFAAMRFLDAHGMDIILARGFGSTGLGLAIEDRLLRASGGKVTKAQ